MRLSNTITQWISAAVLMAAGCVIIVGCGGEGAAPGVSSDTEAAGSVAETSSLQSDDMAEAEFSFEEASASPYTGVANDNESRMDGGFGGNTTNRPGNVAAQPMDVAAAPDGAVASGERTIEPESLPTESAFFGNADESARRTESITSPAPKRGQAGGQQSKPALTMKESDSKEVADKANVSLVPSPAGQSQPAGTNPEPKSSMISERIAPEAARAVKGRKPTETQLSKVDSAAPAAPSVPGVTPHIVLTEEEEPILGFDIPTQARFSKSKVEAVRKTLQLDLQPGEELWIIAKATDSKTAQPSDDTPRCGALMATLPNQTTQVPVPLKHTAVTGNIDGYIATVNVRQQFHNPYDSKIEAVYVFPLPQSAAVNEFVMTVGDRKIRGIIREREKAEQIYAAAKSQGHVASLMTQERANIFTQKVANIEPGKQIDIDIRYFNTLQYDDGAYEFVFPMVVGPRFNPPATADGVGAVARGTSGSSGQKTEVSYLAPNERSGNDISLSLNISAGVDIEDMHCVNHAIDVKDLGETERNVQLSTGDSIPNKDFVLRYKVAGDQIKTAMLTHEDKHGKYFTMMLYPPADLEQVNRSPMEMVFVLDCSGSMKGQPLAQAKAAISHALQSLTPRDTFQIIRFSNNASQLGAEPVLATDENIKRGLKYLTSLNSTGGTHMIEGIKAALDFPHDERRFRLVSFMTDGYIGNEQQILGTMYDKLGASRVFSFGVGSSPNRMLMNRMAILGRGAVAYLSLNDNATEIMDGFNRRISHPAMTDLAIDWGSMRVADVYPQRLPDLIVGRPVVLTGRFKGEPGTVSVNGRVDMEPKSFQVLLDKEKAKGEHPGIAAVWARLKIKDMMNVATHAPEAAEEIKQAVTQTALAYNLMSSFTSFVAVDSLTKTDGEYGTTVAVPVPVPEGVKYETTVGAK